MGVLTPVSVPLVFIILRCSKNETFLCMKYLSDYLSNLFFISSLDILLG